MAGTSFPEGTSVSVATRSRAEEAPDIRKTSLDQEGLPLRRDPSPDSFALGWLLLLLMIGVTVTGVAIVLLRGIYRLPAWP